MISSSRVSRCGAVALAGLTAFSLAACGSTGASGTSAVASGTSSTPTTSSSGPGTSSSASPAPAAGRDHAFGLVGSVSGGAVTLAGPDGTRTVDVTPSTRVTQITPGQLTDVTVGECVLIRPTKDSGKPPTVTAAAVLFRAAGNGRCGGQGAGRRQGVVGTVASATGSTIAITSADNVQTTVTVTPSTRYAKRSTADSSVIAAGQCLTARGTKDGAGNLEAQSVIVRPSNDGKCGNGRRQGG